MSIFGFGEKKSVEQNMEEDHKAIHGDDLKDDCVFNAESAQETVQANFKLPNEIPNFNYGSEERLYLEKEVATLKAKNLKLKQLLLLTDPKVAHVHMGNLQLIQWIEFTKVFRDELQGDLYDQDKRNNNYE